ncbi:phage minor tail protein G, partial [Salmonella enterica subsp. enterica serovar Weltevreden]|nr:phage minor tail protein G [Salmonella enterica subsp. enterica serovar Weltevreden]
MFLKKETFTRGDASVALFELS